MKIKFINRTTGQLETEQPPAEGMLRFLYGNPIGERTLLPLIKQKLLSEWYGRRMNKPASAKKIASFAAQLQIDLTEAQKTVGEFEHFNDFFYRSLKPGARPIGSGFISPGDGRLLAFERAAEVNNFYVKGRKFTLQEFLGDAQLAAEYEGASMVILRLAPNDYHRYHFPWDGVPTASKLIKGAYYSVSPHALVKHFTKVFCENKREICRLQLEGKKDVLLIPVGATMVGSIHSTYQAGQAVKKGDEMGYFAFGGSTIVLLFGAEDFQIDEDLLRNTQNKLETYVKMGEGIGQPR